jgi:hypothetical protein
MNEELKHEGQQEPSSNVQEEAVPVSSPGGVIENVALLDLSGYTPEALARISKIRNVATIIVPESLNGALAGIQMENVASVIPIPDRSKANILTGQVILGGDSFVPADPDTSTLVIIGEAIITSPIREMGYKELHVTGELVAPKESEGILTSVLKRLTGQIAYYESNNARIFMEDQTFSSDFLAMFEEKTHFVIIGDAEFTPDVTAALIKEKISGFTVIGDLKVPAPIDAVVRFLSTAVYGDITKYDPSADGTDGE